MAFIRNSELRRFVSIGKDTPKETSGEVFEIRNRPLSGLRLSASVDISKFRIETQAIHENANLSQSLYDRNGNRLLQLFLKAIYKVIFRIRADKRMRQLKDYISGVSNEKIAPAAEKKFEHHYQAKSKKVQQKSVIPIVKKVIYPVNVPPLPDLMKPRPIALLEPSYAEKKGFVKFPIPDEDNIFNIQVPKLQFDCKTEAEIDTVFEGVYQPTIPEIEITSYTNLDLYVILLNFSHSLESIAWCCKYVYSSYYFQRRIVPAAYLPNICIGRYFLIPRSFGLGSQFKKIYS